MPRQYKKKKSPMRFDQFNCIIDFVWPYLNGKQIQVQKLVLMLAWKFFSAEKGNFYLSVSKVAEDLGVSESSAKRALSELKRQGVLVLKSKGGLNKVGRGYANEFTMLFLHPDAPESVALKFDEIRSGS